MRRAIVLALALAAVALCAAFAGGVSGWGRSLVRGSARPSSLDRYYHGGKVSPAASAAGGCRASGCHARFPHAKARAHASFRNMHVQFVECLACHGKDARKTWAAGGPGRERGGGVSGSRRTIASPAPAVPGEKLHGLTGPPLTCRACHSEEGVRDLAAKGIKDLSPGFVNPVALRMMEEGARQWIPDTMR